MTNQLFISFLRRALLILAILSVAFIFTSVSKYSFNVHASGSLVAEGEECDNSDHEHTFESNTDPITGGRCTDSESTGSDGSTGEDGGLGSVSSDIGVFDPDAPSLDQIITGAIQILLAGAGLLFFVILLLGGLRFLTAGGDEKSTAEARKTLTNGFIGLIIVVVAFLVAQLLFQIFGLDALISTGSNVTNGTEGETLTN